MDFFEKEFHSLDSRTSAILKSEITRITNIFVSDYNISQTFCAPLDELNFKGFSSMLNCGKIVILNMNIAEYKNLSKLISAYLKLDFQSEVMYNLSKNKAKPCAFICDEYAEYVTKTDADFFSLSREAKCINIVSTQSYSSLKNTLKDEKDIDLIITATTTPTNIMPGISNIIQKELGIKTCIAFDILAGCAGFINAIDIAQKYIETTTAKKALVVGIEQLSKYINKADTGTSIILSDGAGAVLLEETSENKKYYSNIETTIDEKDILKTYMKDKKLKLEMNGKEVYKYAVTETVKNLEKLLKESNETLENIKYIVPHQSNLKIIKSIANRLGTDIINKMYINIDKFGNTFCASIPIALDEMMRKKIIKPGDKIILLGYGGALNTASILIEI